MSKETTPGGDCACGQRIIFVDYHLPHCIPAQARAKALGIKQTKKPKTSLNSAGVQVRVV